jgi:DNA primase
LIAQKSIQEVLDTVHIEDIVGDYVGLKRRGVNMIGLCPFHGEKTPSFNVSPVRNIFKCFGCGKGGDSVTFLREHDSMSFEEAIRHIARRYNIALEEIELSQEIVQERQQEESLYLINNFALEFYQKQMLETDLGKSIALSYFKKRGFRDDTLEKFSLGYAPESYDSLTKSAISAGYKDEFLKKLKLTTDSNRDFFRARVMFPIQNLTGKVVAFAGRTLSSDKSQPKYINSPESELYHKSKVLYGAFQGKKEIAKQDLCIVVEGYADVISLHQAGIENAVAPCGTALNEGHAQLLKRLTRSGNILFLFDGDAAGIAAATKNLKNVLSQDLNVKVAILPDGEDPDSYVSKHGAEALRQFIDQSAQDFIYFKIAMQKEQIERDPIEKVKLLREIIELIALIPDQLKRSVYVKECASRLEIGEDSLIQELNKVLFQEIAKKRQQSERENRNDNPYFPTASPEEELEFITTPKQTHGQKPPEQGSDFQEKDIVRILLLAGDKTFEDNEAVTVAEFIIANIDDVIDDFDNKTFERVAKECAELVRKGEKVTFKYFLNHSDESFRRMAVDFSTSPDEYSPNWTDERRNSPLKSQKMPEDNFSNDSTQSILNFRLRRLMRLCEKNQAQIKAFPSDGDFEDLSIMLRAQHKLVEMRNTMAAQLGMVILR